MLAATLRVRIGHLREVQVDDKEEGEVQQLKVVHQVASARSQRRRDRAEEHLRRASPRRRGGLAGRRMVAREAWNADRIRSGRTLNAASVPWAGCVMRKTTMLMKPKAPNSLNIAEIAGLKDFGVECMTLCSSFS